MDLADLAALKLDGDVLDALGWARPPWWDDAACRGQGVARFFPEMPRGHRIAQSIALEEARSVCAGCPVRAPCLEVALRLAPTVDFAGVYGGTTWKDRKRLRELGSPSEVAQAWAAGSLSLQGVAVA